jgi:hypothetical protein
MKDVLYRLIQVLSFFAYFGILIFSFLINEFPLSLIVALIGLIIVDFLRACLIYIISGNGEIENTIILSKIWKNN